MKDYRTILKNFTGSYLMKRHYGLMIILVPFLIRTIGLEQYGRLEFCKAIAYYFTIVINFGFNYSATQQILLHIHNKSKLGEIVSSTYIAKGCLSVVSFFVLLALIWIFHPIAACKDILFPFFGLAIASAFTPGFIYQGLDKMDWLVGIDFTCRSIFLGCVFIFIRSPEDVALYPMFYVVADTTRTIVSMMIAYFNFDIKFVIPSFTQVRIQLAQSTNMFISTISRTVYDRLPQVILGLLLGPKSVGIYVVGTRIVGEINMLIYQLMQSIFPIVAKKIKHNFVDGLTFIKSFGVKILVIVGVLCSACFLFAEKIVVIFAKYPIPESVILLRLCAFLPMIIFIYTLLGNSILIPFGFGKRNSIIVLIMSVMATVSYILLMSQFREIGVICSILVAEVLTLFGVIWVSVKIIADKNQMKNKQ